MMKELLELHKEGKLNQHQEDWFKPTKPMEELYDVVNDPHELHNLAENPMYRNKLEELRKVFRMWMNEVGDLSYIHCLLYTSILFYLCVGYIQLFPDASPTKTCLFFPPQYYLYIYWEQNEDELIYWYEYPRNKVLC